MKRWLCILGLDFFFLLCNIVLLVHYGFFGDVYPNVKDFTCAYYPWFRSCFEKCYNSAKSQKEKEDAYNIRFVLFVWN